MHEFLQELNTRALSDFDTYTVGESYMPDPEHAHRYIKRESGELDSIFDFAHLTSDSILGLKFLPKPFDLLRFKLGLLTPQMRYFRTGWNTLVLENHDCPRSVSRFGIDTKRYRYEAATFLALITFLGWGTPFIYQGEEIGMTNADFRSMDELKDPVSHFVYDLMTKTVHLPRGLAFRLIRYGARDHARTPMQWDGGPNGGFNAGAEPWQCVNGAFREINAAKDLASDRSVYRFYQRLLAFRAKARPPCAARRACTCRRAGGCWSTPESWTGADSSSSATSPIAAGASACPFGFEARRLKVRLTNYEKQLPRPEMTLRPYEAIVFEEV